MILKLFTIKDVVAQEAPIILSAQNEAMLVRQLKSAMLSREPNFINTHIADKQVFAIGEYDLTLCKIMGCEPVMVTSLQQVYEELIEEVRRRNELTKGVAPDAEVPDHDGSEKA